MNRRAWITGRAAAAVSAACLAAVITGAGPATAGTSMPAGAAAGLPGMLSAPVPAVTPVPVPAAGTASDPHGSDLNSVAAVSARRAWAVGFRYHGTVNQTLIERWNGRNWRRVPSPDPGGSVTGSSNQLMGVAATSARNAWAVGSWSAGGAQRMLIEHWNGRIWTQVSSHFTGCLQDNDGLSAVTATSARNAWAVGTATSCVLGFKITVILHWDGHAWHQVTSPDPGALADNYLRGVAATSARDAWAVGFYTTTSGGTLHPLIAHWDGRAWTQVPSPSPYSDHMGLLAAAARTPARAWTVGEATTGSLGSTQQLAFHWNGAAWKQTAASSQAGQGLSAVAVVPGTHTAWAAGFRVSSTSPVQTLIERWTGTSWQRVSSPSPGAGQHVDELLGVAAVSARSAWVVGEYTRGAEFRALIEHWNSHSWRVTQG